MRQYIIFCDELQFVSILGCRLRRRREAELDTAALSEGQAGEVREVAEAGGVGLS